MGDDAVAAGSIGTVAAGAVAAGKVELGSADEATTTPGVESLARVS
jgi:hypothetical protein